ncbi:hypothetical protein EVAR_59109_1 [Eumeta japonica]|uniref:Uncharacterized protein n=1 Tax=Eumeta variegata TaxID=151549 RepID=A0A4C1Z055_EUMVA|nr:hypothetical protein EVAR_59109_1 [Eumeta japonica]
MLNGRQGAIPGRTDRPLHAHGRSKWNKLSTEQSELAAPSAPIAPAAQGQTRPIRATYVPSQHMRHQHGTHSAPPQRKSQAQQSIALRMIVGAGRYVLNDVIARDLCIETVEVYPALPAGCSTSLIRAHMNSSEHRTDARGRRA